MLDHAGDKYYYGVRIVTGSAEGAGADFTNEIYMKLVGSNGESGRVKLTDFVTTMEGSFRRKRCALFDHYWIHSIQHLSPKLHIHFPACSDIDRNFRVAEECTSLPPNFHVTNEMVKGFLNRGRTLEQEMEVGQLKC